MVQKETTVMKLAGKTALVTGATSNIGRAIAVAFAREGAHVLLTGRSAARAEAVLAQIRSAGGKADALLVELDGSKASADALAKDATAKLGGHIDILVNNAAIYPPNTTPTTDEATFDRVYGVNVKAPYFLTAAIAPAMAARGGGVILNLGSWIVRLAVPVAALYTSTKGAMETLTRAWSAEFGRAGVRVNAISPGVVHEPVDHEMPGDVMMRGTPANRYGTPESIAAAAVYLASDDASFVHGTVLDVDGGRTAVAVIAAPGANSFAP